MRYKLLLLDIDGTLRPGSCEQIPKENAAAVRAVQKAGVKIAIATGRGRTGVGKGLLRDLKPDYWVCAGGAQLVDAKGNDLALHRLTAVFKTSRLLAGISNSGFLILPTPYVFKSYSFTLTVTPSPTGRISVTSWSLCFNSYRYSLIRLCIVRFLLVTA